LIDNPEHDRSKCARNVVRGVVNIRSWPEAEQVGQEDFSHQLILIYNHARTLETPLARSRGTSNAAQVPLSTI
jgi:hypothetical protein